MTSPHVFETMGTVASVRTSEPAPRTLRRRIEAVFASFEQTFSRFLPDSPASRYARGEVTLEQAGPALGAALERAEWWQHRTSGSFAPFAGDGSCDLTGIVKALAMERAAGELDAAVSGWLLNVGGDLSWRPSGRLAEQACGIADPTDPGSLLCSVPLSGRWSAAATSGTSERGEHILRTDRSAEVLQATVLAGDVVTADVLATAVVSGGRGMLADAAARFGVDVFAVMANGEVVFTDGMAEHLVGADPAPGPVERAGQRRRRSR